jgi:monovalent cation:H+ antiporter-2, CPA2 family
VGTEFLPDLLLIIGIGVVVVVVLRKLGLPSIAGFIFAGALAGPNALGFVKDVRRVEAFAELGVVLLLFGVGLELSLDRFRRLWRAIVFGGTLQVGLTILLAAGLANLGDVQMRPALFLGCFAAASSTAIVLRGLTARGEIDSPYGRLTVGILIFQDLCVIPMMLLIPVFAGAETSLWAVLKPIGIAALVLAGILVAARLVVPRVLEVVARTRQRDLFVLAVLLVCLGTAWATTGAGLSLALGAFLGGLVVAGSEYRHQALSDLIPFRELFASLFFVSVGMLLDPHRLADRPGAVLLLLLAILVGKFLAVLETAILLRLGLRSAVLSAAALAHVGEFSFVLAHEAKGTTLLAGDLGADLLSASALSMLLAPLLMAFSPGLAAGAGRLRWLTRLLDVPADEARAAAAASESHVIVAGYGVAGEELCRALRDCQIPYVIVDLNPRNVHRAAARGEPAFFGDVTGPEILDAVGARRAKELVILINDPAAAERTVKAARQLAPALHIVVRSRYVGDIAPLLKAGASHVVPAELEAAVEIVAQVLARHQVGPGRLSAELARVRERREENLG